MKTNQYTSLELSKLLNEKMEYENSEWVYQEIHALGKNVIGVFLKGENHSYIAPAFNFTDLLHWLKLYGEKMGWEDVCCGCKQIAEDCNCECSFYPSEPRIEYYRHKLLDCYTADGDTIGTHVESFLLDVIK